MQKIEVQIVPELQKARAFVGLTKEQRREMEKKIKQRYSISDFEESGGIGWLIHDNEKNKDSFLSANARLTLETRYLEKDENRGVIENVLDLFTRVAVNIAEAELKYFPEKDIVPLAKEFLELIVYQQFMPNTPTLCNAGRALQQLSACFVLPVEDYMATDDIGEDPEKQGNGIYDTLRYMAMIHKSGGGTGFNFSHLRPRSDMISTTFGSSSGPVSFIKTFDSSTDAINQGGFRRGANMGILNYNHPDIFEFVAEKVRNQSLRNFNLSVGLDGEFMKKVKEDGYFKLISPKGENKLSIEERIWKKHKLLIKGESSYDKFFTELDPSLVIDKDGESVMNVYTWEKVGKIDSDDTVLISARALFDELIKYAWQEGCPGVIFLDRIEKNNKTPHIGKIESTNPCGEQPLLPFEACNLGGINLATCVKDGQINYEELERRINIGVRFLDNVIDMSKFPFQKVYEKVHGTRKIGMGIMGWAEMLTQLKISYDSSEAIELAKKLMKHITEFGRKRSQEIAEEKGVFPFWTGSVYETQGIKVRNTTITTIAPNGTTGMICNVTGGIEPFFKLAYKKTCMDEKELIYRIPLLVKELGKRFDGEKLKRILNEVDEKGSIQDIEEIPEDLKKIFKTSHDIAPEWHVKMQAAFQSGVDNAVSKTVNLPESATIEDVKKIYHLAYEEGCVGITVFRDNCKAGVYSSLKQETQLVQNNVKYSPILDKKAQAIKYKVKRPQNQDSLHIILTSDLYVDDETKKAYFIPDEIFQMRAPLGHSASVSFAQSGMDRTDILKGHDPNYVKLIERLQSVSSNEEEGIGPMKIKSIDHAAGIVLEDYCLRNGIVGMDSVTGKLKNIMKKTELRRIEHGTEEFNTIISQVRVGNSEELIVKGTHGKLGIKFVCEECSGEEYTFEAGCNHPKCVACGALEGGGCG